MDFRKSHYSCSVAFFSLNPLKDSAGLRFAAQREHGFRELSAVAAGEEYVRLCAYVIKSYRFLCQVFRDLFF